MKGLRHRTSKNIRLSLLATFIVVLTIPFVMYGVLETESLDTSSGASEGNPEVTTCDIDFLYVNPETIEVGTTVQLETRATVQTQNEFIKSLKIVSSDGELLVREYPEGTESLSEKFNFTAQLEGNNQLLGTLTTNLDIYPCIVQDVDSNEILAMAINNPPRFTSSPGISAQPSNFINIEDSYLYKLEAEDADKDDIEYSYSLSPKAKWLSVAAVKDGSGGKLELEFKGNADQTGSYLANVFIHDGYNRHISSQSWVISVEPAENDIPLVRINQPKGSISVKQGEKITVAWSAEDENQIVKYRLYYAQNPGNTNSWKLLTDKISYKDNQYSVDTSKIKPGTYKFILEAEDNQEPAAIGKGVSGEVIIKSKDSGEDPTPTEPEEPGDGPILQDPQIVNINPSDGSEISNNRKTLSATIIAGTEAEIIKESIQMLLDDNDISSELDISEISKSEMTVIFKPTEDLQSGEHRVEISFNDTKEGSAERAWTFTITGGTDSENIDSISIFGYMIPKRIAIIVGIGLGVLFLALIIPWLLYLAWRNSDDDNNTIIPVSPWTDQNRTGFNSPPTGPNTYYKPNMKSEEPQKQAPTAPTITETVQPQKPDENVPPVVSSDTPFVQDTPGMAKPMQSASAAWGTLTLDPTPELIDEPTSKAPEKAEPEPIVEPTTPPTAENPPEGIQEPTHKLKAEPSDPTPESQPESIQNSSDTLRKPNSNISFDSSMQFASAPQQDPGSAASVSKLQPVEIAAPQQEPSDSDRQERSEPERTEDNISPQRDSPQFTTPAPTSVPTPQSPQAPLSPPSAQEALPIAPTNSPANNQHSAYEDMQLSTSPIHNAPNSAPDSSAMEDNPAIQRAMKPPMVEDLSTEGDMNNTVDIPLPAPITDGFNQPADYQNLNQPVTQPLLANDAMSSDGTETDSSHNGSDDNAEIQALAKELEKLKNQNGQSKFPAYLQNGDQDQNAPAPDQENPTPKSNTSGVTFAAPPPSQE